MSYLIRERRHVPPDVIRQPDSQRVQLQRRTLGRVSIMSLLKGVLRLNIRQGGHALQRRGAGARGARGAGVSPCVDEAAVEWG